MENEIGLMILSGCNPLLGVSKKAIEALGSSKSFCLLVNLEKKLLMITPDSGKTSAVRLSQTSETQDYYWVRGLVVYRIMDAFGISGENKLVHFPAKHDPTMNVITGSCENSEICDLESADITDEVRRFMSHNFHLKDRKNRTTPNALDIKCCKTTPRKEHTSVFQNPTIQNK